MEKREFSKRLKEMGYNDESIQAEWGLLCKFADGIRASLQDASQIDEHMENYMQLFVSGPMVAD
jgi:hypothetical protein